MFVFTKQEQRFLLFLVITFIIGLGVKHFRQNISARPDNGWQQERTKLIAEFQEKSQQLDREDNAVVSDAPQTASITKKSLTGTININTANSEELQLLPRIGPATAQKIIAYRTENGPFVQIADIQKVKNIGPKTFDKIKEYITVD